MGKVLRRDEHVAFLDAKGLIRRARDDATRVAEQAREAYRRECERGYAEGMQAARVEQAAAMLSVARQTADYLRQVEREMAELVVAAVRRIVGDFDATDRALTVVRGGLAVLRRQKNVLLRMHTDDAAVVRQHMQALLAQFPGVDYLDVVPDDRLARGTCRMETPIGTIETSLDQQLDVVQRALEIALADQGGSRPAAMPAQDDV
ncbi:HrpE/YscL family type III secretion apparatus protein [Bordetella genomosp. 9]|uniref:HrpE/YscL family type III secretion apparatus protein n=1 Tax=Bordetella genomosp. 9 TaxID=1416803 RepID=UPI0015C58A40|nr:HrpE/YscL family type III secretion apparatus protein [Bordetella genomosp. 9]